MPNFGAIDDAFSLEFLELIVSSPGERRSSEQKLRRRILLLSFVRDREHLLSPIAINDMSATFFSLANRSSRTITVSTRNLSKILNRVNLSTIIPIVRPYSQTQ